MVKSKKLTQCHKEKKKTTTIEQFEKLLKGRLENTSLQIHENMKRGRATMTQLNKNRLKLKSSDLPISPCYLCPLCTKMYNTVSLEPILLPCGHSICRPCLLNLKHSLFSGNCPFDSKEFYYIEGLLPVNYALLNSSMDPFSHICPSHRLSVLGFCIDDWSLMCGKCFFSHNTHDCIELDSLMADELAEKQLMKVKILEEKLKKMLIAWEVYKDLIAKNEEIIKDIISSHAKNVRKIESELILEIHSRTDKIIQCILEYQEIIVAKAADNAKDVIECIKYHLNCTESLKGMFSLLDICEKLSLYINQGVEYSVPVEIVMKDIMMRFDEEINYRDLILGGTCGTT
ncbi:hypothetical protein SteCoe_31429 [Stentor coeruleus]|uniref:RING-type domain-containing protein n=1 Tax=Stentor coeruleus TaxID=5963 RepID=A0A1R2B1B9_9CILI|nr:hypothetical protein SteCoe_31429 [Stentor coeruleus]